MIYRQKIVQRIVLAINNLASQYSILLLSIIKITFLLGQNLEAIDYFSVLG